MLLDPIGPSIVEGITPKTLRSFGDEFRVIDVALTPLSIAAVRHFNISS